MDAASDSATVTDMIVAAVAVVLSWALLIALGKVRHCSARALLDLGQDARTERPTSIERLGQFVTQGLRIPCDPTAARSVGRSIVCGICIAPIAPVAGAITVLISPVLVVRRARKQAQISQRDSADALADVVDLFAMALSSGATVAVAVAQAAMWARDPLRGEFQRCLNDARLGAALADSLEAIPVRSGAHTRPLVAALVAHDRYGAPILQNLSQISVDTRSDRRRRAEAQARRLPVTLLFPLVTCVLPAFLLLTVVPVVADTISSLDLLASP